MFARYVKAAAAKSWAFVRNNVRKGVKSAKNNPRTATACAIVLVAAAIPAILAGIGFTSSGIAAGSVAAGIQAGIGNVAAHSGFATFTSAMMGGYGVAAVGSFVLAVGATVYAFVYSYT
ncbi:hypothetical protein B0H67DRAFT_236617 [Lasiosphaeris hirsuta]|uniref:Uncharacterized protein n=1 Tax=Lasiosphaeris hirsuta TaxID=260670 RepID=A0AA40DXE7_9PEZI|nr:hypothetical protein B0H67DRAFT_236617 [Lasiosphaeris hirsuta]